MRDERALLWLGMLPSARFWVWCAIAVSGGLSSCGGLAADGPGLETNVPGVSASGDEPGAPGAEPTSIGPRRETCEDNPLLAGCPYASGGNPTSTPEGPVEVPAEETPLYLALAENVLLAHCGPCHGPALSPDQASARINYIDDWDRLLRLGLIEECSPERSRIIEVMRTGEMPPSGSGLSPVPDADVEVVVQAVEIECYTR